MSTYPLFFEPYEPNCGASPQIGGGLRGKGGTKLIANARAFKCFGFAVTNVGFQKYIRELLVKSKKKKIGLGNKNRHFCR